MNGWQVLGIVVGSWVLLALLVWYGWWLLRTAKPSKVQEEKVDQAEETAKAVDPDDPPRWVTYRPKGPPRHHCTCHQRAIEVGERVLWWPIPGSGGAVDLFCTETVQEAQ